MRKVFLSCALAAVLLLSGCNSVSYSVYQSDIAELEQVIEEKDAKITELEADIENYLSDIEKYKEQIDELENGSQRLFSSILNAFENKEYNRTIKLAKEIHARYNGTPEDDKAQELAQQAQIELDNAEAKAKEDKEKREAEAAKSMEEQVHEIIQIDVLEVDDINSAGGVDVHIGWTNRSNKTIKYIDFGVSPYNAVGDKVRCEITKKDFKWLESVGPIAPGDGGIKLNSGERIGSYWGTVWYNSTIKTLKFESIEIEYMDGTKKELTGQQLRYVFW